VAVAFKKFYISKNEVIRNQISMLWVVAMKNEVLVCGLLVLILFAPLPAGADSSGIINEDLSAMVPVPAGTSASVPAADTATPGLSGQHDVVPYTLPGADRATAETKNEVMEPAGPAVPAVDFSARETSPAYREEIGLPRGFDQILLQPPRYRLGFYDIISYSPLFAIDNRTSPAVISRKPGVIDMVYYNNTSPGNIRVNWSTRNGHSFYGWDAPVKIDDYSILYSPAVYSWNATNFGYLQVTAQRNFWMKEWNEGPGWGDWIFAANGDVYSTPAVVAHGGNLEIVYLNATGTFIRQRFNKTSNAWTRNESISGPGIASGDVVSIASTAPDRFIVMAWDKGLTDHLYYRRYTESGGWDAWWTDTGIRSYSGPAIAADNNPDYPGGLKDQRLYLVYKGDAGFHNYTWHISPNGGASWGLPSGAVGWIGDFHDAFTVTAAGYNRPEFFGSYQEVRGTTFTGQIPDWIWQGPRHQSIGIFRPSTHLFYLDYNGNGAWNGAVTDRTYNFGIAGDIPITGDWNSDGIIEIGIFRPSTHLFYLDYNGNGAWNGAVTDRSFNFGITGDIPITGDWDNNGVTDIGVFRPSTHLFYLDYNGNGVWNGAVTDHSYDFGITGDIPITGDWNNNGITEIGVFRPSTHLFYLDYNGNGVWNGAMTDRSYNFGITGDIPVTGDWDSDGITEIGVFRPSTHLYYQDYNGNGVWNGAVTDRSYNFGITGDTPVSGSWN
jgi:hypothetical protein